MIQANYHQLPETKAQNGDKLIESSDIYFLLNRDHKTILTNDQILKGKRAKAQISNILYFFQHKLRKTNTNGGNILYLLFTPAMERYSQPEVLNKIQKYINAYKKEEENTVDKNYADILSLLDKVADQLDNNNYIQQPEEPNSVLGQLAQLVREFSKAYKSKQNNKNKLNKPTRKLKLSVSSDLSGSSNEQEASNNAENSRTHNNEKQQTNKGNEKKGEEEEAEEMIHSVNQNQKLDEISKNQQGKVNLAQILKGSTANNQNCQNQTTLKSNLTKIRNNKDNKETTKEKNEEAQSNHHSTTNAIENFPAEQQEPIPLTSYYAEGDKKSIKQYDTYTEAILAYTWDIKDQTKALTNQQHIDFLSQYIDNRLIKYQVLMIQTKYKQVPQLGIQNGNPEQIATKQYNLLRTELNRQQKQERILPNNKPSEPIIQFLQHLDILERIPEGERTQEQKILSLLFLGSKGDTDILRDLTELTDLITNYTKAENRTLNIKSSGSTDWLKYLNAVAKQLDKEAEQLKRNSQECMLPKLAQLVRTFCEKRKEQPNPNEQPKQQNQPQPPKQQIAQPTKLNQQEQLQQQQPSRQQQRKNIASASTYIKALQLYANSKNNDYLSEAEFQQFLKDYINNSKVKYLALLIQANYNLFNFPANIKQIDPAIHPLHIHHLLLNNSPQEIYPPTFMQDTPTTQEIEKILESLQPRKKKGPYKLTNEAKILEALFSNNTQTFKEESQKDEELDNLLEQLIQNEGLKPQQRVLAIFKHAAKKNKEFFANLNTTNMQVNKERIKKLTESIENYKSNEPIEAEQLPGEILSLLRDIAKQLKEEANAQTNLQIRAQLMELASQIDKISNADQEEERKRLEEERLKQEEERLKQEEEERRKRLEQSRKTLQETLQWLNELMRYEREANNREAIKLKNNQEKQEPHKGEQVANERNDQTEQNHGFFNDLLEEIGKELSKNNNKQTTTLNRPAPKQNTNTTTTNTTSNITNKTTTSTKTKTLQPTQTQQTQTEQHPKPPATDPLQKPQQQKPKKSASQRTHIKALQVYVETKKIKKLEVEEYNKFLISYIKHNIATYLALLIQANYNLLQFPDNIETIDSAINYTSLYKNFATDNCAQIYPYSFMDDYTFTTVIKWKLQDLQQIYKKTTGPLKPAEQILNILFNPAPKGADYDTRIESLKEAIKKYKDNRSVETGYSYHNTLLYLGQIAQKLHNEANALPNSTTKQQLNDLATLINKFFKEYAPINGLQVPDNQYTNNTEDIKENNTKTEQEEEEEEEGKRHNEEAEKRKQEERNTIDQEAKGRRQKKEEEKAIKEKEESERAEKIAKLIEGTNQDLNRNKETNRKLTTTQKIINNLSATNKMIQIIMQILY